MLKKFESLFPCGFTRSVGVLVGGTAVAQLITVLALPLLTRIYTPDDFSVLSVYVSTLGVISIAACLRFEIAIPLPQQDRDSANLLALALCSSTGIAALSALAVALFHVQIVDLVAQPKLEPYLWLLPLGVWLSGSYAALQFWTTRQGRFSVIAKTRLSQAIGGTGAQVGLGLANSAPLGLLLGQIISSSAGIVRLAFEALKHDRSELRLIGLSDMKRTFQEYKRFPQYSTLEALANNAGIYLPVIVIAALSAGPEAGFLLLATRTMQTPMGLIGGAVAQVYLARAPDEFRAGTLSKFTINTFSGLTKVGVGPLLFMGIVAPQIFSLVFGKQWERAGELVFWMTPWFVLQFISSPISMVMHVRTWQKAMLILTTFGLAVRVGAIVLSANFDRQYLSECYAVSSAAFYFICTMVFLHAANIGPKELMNKLTNSLPILIGWVVSAIVSRFALEYIIL
jgi:O-antigen/teichoic acid export membrane protein